MRIFCLVVYIRVPLFRETTISVFSRRRSYKGLHEDVPFSWGAIISATAVEASHGFRD